MKNAAVRQNTLVSEEAEQAAQARPNVPALEQDKIYKIKKLQARSQSKQQGYMLSGLAFWLMGRESAKSFNTF